VDTAPATAGECEGLNCDDFVTWAVADGYKEWT